ncbi:hypothetical protein [Hyalangium versicolor]|uniref:hypothetical protein n=1 Tax=Hyalangium versicolor TaxID=2861190 RepID=UPI001CD03A78|nr:hypothetical protein [Hyalangium versicolor]
MRILMLVGVLLLAPGCVVVPARRGAAPPPPPPSRQMSYDEAVGLGYRFCRSRGYSCDLQEAHKTGNDVWKVKFRASAPGARGQLHLDYNAYSRELLRVDDDVKGKRGGRDDDWDGDHRRGRGPGRH